MRTLHLANSTGAAGLPTRALAGRPSRVWLVLATDGIGTDARVRPGLRSRETRTWAVRRPQTSSERPRRARGLPRGQQRVQSPSGLGHGPAPSTCLTERLLRPRA